MAMLDVKDLHVHYGAIEALKGVSLKVEPGQIVSLIGANGAGKTSLLQAISGIVKRAVEKSSLKMIPSIKFRPGKSSVPVWFRCLKDVMFSRPFRL